MEMPPLPLMVLDALADDMENLESLRNHGEVAPFGLALVDEQDVLSVLRTLLHDGLIQARKPSDPPVELLPCPQPSADDASLRSYWFKWTEKGERVWREAHDVLDAYWDAHPIGG